MSKFNVGDKIRVVNDHDVWLKEGTIELDKDSILTVVDDECADLSNHEICIEILRDWPADFELVFSITQEKTDQSGKTSFERTLLDGYKEKITKIHESREPGILGVFRPNLEDRKVGKVRVELVDDGFPLALREIAKVMTWAQTAKGYKDHDWQNLPNPEQGLAGATSRHRTDHIIQRQVGKSAAIECTDHESNILHKAHEAFGVLAQLELILRGVIK